MVLVEVGSVVMPAECPFKVLIVAFGGLAGINDRVIFFSEVIC